MSKIHEANRRLWNNQAPTWEERLNRDGRWRKCHKEPELAFEAKHLPRSERWQAIFATSRCVSLVAEITWQPMHFQD